MTIDRCYGSEEMQEAAELYTQTNERESASLEDQVFQEDVNASPVVVLVNSLVEQAVRQRASDIHVESGPDKVRGPLPSGRRAVHHRHLRPAAAARHHRAH